MKKFEIKINDEGKRLDSFMARVCPTMPKALLYKYIRIKRIKVNSKRAQIGTRLRSGDTVEAYISDEFFEQKLKTYDFLSSKDNITVVYEDENILLADKPQGLIVHPDKNEYRDTLIGRIQHYLYNKGEYDPEKENSFAPALANRIDRNTAGIVIAAKNAQALKILCEKIKNREIDKLYLAAVHGKLKKESGILEAFLEKNSEKNKVYLSRKKTDNNLLINTGYRTVAYKSGLSLLEIKLYTGRTHQIRAQFASIGHPLLGDGKYGSIKEDKKIGYNKQALYSYKITFDFKTDAGILSYLDKKTFCVKDVFFSRELFGINSEEINNPILPDIHHKS